MTADDSDQPIDRAFYEKRLLRLERRAARERSAREQAERIAEDGMRRLFLANQDLDERVAKRTEELDGERRAAARSAGERDEFLRLLSRETRSPLNGVIGVMEVLDENAESEQVRAWLANGLESARTLDSIMTRLLLFLELEGEDRCEQTMLDPHEVLASVRDSWKRDALSAGLLVSAESLCPSNVGVLAHADSLRLVLDELMANAVKHADPGLLRVTADVIAGGPGRDDAVVFSIQDPGPGIADTKPLLDADFHDWHNTGARGMGYSLIKRLADRAGAIVDVDSAHGSSTTVSLTLPAVRQQ